jgi:glycosyltransferase involved in cell wall biosynthesis
MRIGIEAQRIFRIHKHGMDIVALELIRALQQIDKLNDYFIFVRKGEDSSCLQETDNFKIVPVPGISYADWEQLFLPLYAHRYKLDILHCTSNTAPLFYRKNLAITLHDVIFLEQDSSGKVFSWYQRLGRIYRKYIVPQVASKASHLITVSNYEKQRILKMLPARIPETSVIYNAVGKHFFQIPDQSQIDMVKATYELPEQYIFYIGNTDPKKNIFRTMRAYRHYCIQVADPLPLLIADVTEKFLDTVMDETDTRSLRGRIRLTGYIRNQDLPLIYACSSMFLYPSLRESFGIPVLEAMACGTPVVTSNTTALPEIAGDAACFADPLSEKSIGEAILRVLHQPSFSQELIEKGKHHCRTFDWRISAVQLHQLYQQITQHAKTA